MKLLAAALGSVVPLAAADAGPRQLQAACAADQVADCNGACAQADWLGDGFCDDSYEGHSLNCDALNSDEGDCSEITGDDDFVVDCSGQRAPVSWMGDGACDNGVYQHNGRWINLNCVEAMWDGGDCAELSLNHMTCLQTIRDLDHCEGECSNGRPQPSRHAVA